MEDRSHLRARMWCPGLPGRERVGGPRPRPPDDECGDQPGYRVHPKRQARDHTEVPATAAAERPVQARIAVSACSPEVSVSGHELSAEEIVCGETELASGEAHAAAQSM